MFLKRHQNFKKGDKGIPWRSNANSLGAFSARRGSIPSWGTKIPQGTRHGQKKKKREKGDDTSFKTENE